LPQIPQLVDQLLARPLAARKRPGDLSMRQAEIDWAHTTYVVAHLICAQSTPLVVRSELFAR
jgi:hypothetical protein